MTEHREPLFADALGEAELDGFEIWDRTVHAPAGKGRSVAFVSVRVGGVIGINRAAREMLGWTDAVKVMYGPKRKRLGLVPCDPRDENSYDVSYWSNTQISCKKLFDYYGVEVTEGRRYEDLRVIDGSWRSISRGPAHPARHTPGHTQGDICDVGCTDRAGVSRTGASRTL